MGCRRLSAHCRRPTIFPRGSRWAQMLSDLHRELSADGLDCETVFAEAAKCDGFNETVRWKLLAELERQYLRLLDSLQVWDKQTARLFAIEHRECSTEKQIVLVGLVDLNRAQRQMLDLVSERVTRAGVCTERLDRTI